MQKQLCIDLDRNLAVNADGVQLAARPVLILGEQPEYRITFGRMTAGRNGETAFTPEDLSPVVTWRLSVDKDFTRATAPMCRTVMADGIDVSGAGNGVIVFPVDTGTESFFAAVDGKEYLNCFLQIVGWDADGRQTVFVRLPWSAWGNIDYNGATEVVPQDTLTGSALRAILAAGIALQYSATGGNDAGHDAQSADDRFWRMRAVGVENAAWSGWIAMVAGPRGAAGQDGEDRSAGTLTLVRPVSDLALFPVVEASANADFANAVTLDARGSAADRACCKVFTGTQWTDFPAAGLGTTFAGLAVAVDMSTKFAALSQPYYVRCCWRTAAGADGQWESLRFPSVGVPGSKDTASRVLPVVTLGSPAFAPVSGTVYEYTVAANDEIIFTAPTTTGATVFELRLTVPDPAPAFTFGNTLTWLMNSAAQVASPGTHRLRVTYIGGVWEVYLPDLSQYALTADFVPKTGGTFTGQVSAPYFNATTGLTVGGNSLSSILSGYASLSGTNIFTGSETLKGALIRQRDIIDLSKTPTSTEVENVFALRDKNGDGYFRIIAYHQTTGATRVAFETYGGVGITVVTDAQGNTHIEAPTPNVSSNAGIVATTKFVKEAIAAAFAAKGL